MRYGLFLWLGEICGYKPSLVVMCWYIKGQHCFFFILKLVPIYWQLLQQVCTYGSRFVEWMELRWSLTSHAKCDKVQNKQLMVNLNHEILFVFFFDNTHRQCLVKMNWPSSKPPTWNNAVTYAAQLFQGIIIREGYNSI